MNYAKMYAGKKQQVCKQKVASMQAKSSKQLANKVCNVSNWGQEKHVRKAAT